VWLQNFKNSFKDVTNSIQSLNTLFSGYFSFAIIILCLSIIVEIVDFGYFLEISSDPDMTKFWSPVRVRALTGLFLVASGKIGLVVYIRKVVRGTNEEAKYLLVSLNDLMSGKEAAADLPQETYQAVSNIYIYICYGFLICATCMYASMRTVSYLFPLP
jgi:hypothetical protein